MESLREGGEVGREVGGESRERRFGRRQSGIPTGRKMQQEVGRR